MFVLSLIIFRTELCYLGMYDREERDTESMGVWEGNAGNGAGMLQIAGLFADHWGTRYS